MREFVDVPSNPPVVAERLASCGFEVASVDGDTIDFEITANRPDCLSVYGLAREASAAFDLDLKPVDSRGPELKGHAPVPVSVGDAGCGRYALAVADVRIGPSPAWLADRLLAAGVRPINNVVDVTNYVMLEMGQPMHAFDVSRLGGPEIRVRRARAGESLVTLDGITRTLDETMLVIADKDRPIAVAGVMGGASSEVSSSTTRIALESAWFLPASVRATSRKLGLKTEASARFERGADPTAPVRALRRALQLLEQIEAGAPVGGVSDVNPRPVQPRSVPLARAHVSRLLGDTVPDQDIIRILSRLGFAALPVEAPTPYSPVTPGEGWQVTVPPFRVDVTREADLIEDVGRHWGFNRIPATFPTLDTVPRPMSPAVARDRRLRGILCGAGLQETCTFSFLERQAAEPFLPPATELVAIANPLSEKFAVLRPSLLPGLLDALVYSRRRETDDVRLFEAGAIFLPGGEANRVGWILTGARTVHWGGSAGELDVFDAKGIAELIGEAFGVAVTTRPTTVLPWYVPGRAAEVLISTPDTQEMVVGHVGELLPAIVAARGLTQGTVVAGELDHVAVESRAPGLAHAIQALPRFPSIVRDVSIVVSDRLPAADVRGTIRSTAPRTLVSVREFDRYQGKGVPEGSTSLSLRLTFRDAERTLTDAEVQQAMDTIVGALAASHGAVLRGRAD
jgi:phenylalanyl-tRNA synthetase beta chain